MLLLTIATSLSLSAGIDEGASQNVQARPAPESTRVADREDGSKRVKRRSRDDAGDRERPRNECRRDPMTQECSLSASPFAAF